MHGTDNRRVIVTGASSGIGAAFARRLAGTGMNLLLVARRQDRMADLKKELVTRHGIDIDVLAADLAAPDAAAEIEAFVRQNGWQICGLINNAGFGANGAFEALPLDKQLAMITVNISSLVALTHRFIPALKSAQGAFIINVASTAAFQAVPGMAVYGATKAFVLSFTEALHEELKSTGIAVSALCPGATASEFAQTANIELSRLFRLGVMSADAVAATALAKRRRAGRRHGMAKPGVGCRREILVARDGPQDRGPFDAVMKAIRKRARGEEQKALRRAQILAAAEARFHATGYERISLSEIAADVGLTKAALYRYFRSKEALFIGLFDRAFARLLEGARTVDARDPAGPSPKPSSAIRFTAASAPS